MNLIKTSLEGWGSLQLLFFKMATNEGWPEAFGFSLSYGAPCVVNWIEEGGSAEESGLQVNTTIYFLFTSFTI